MGAVFSQRRHHGARQRDRAAAANRLGLQEQPFAIGALQGALATQGPINEFERVQWSSQPQRLQWDVYLLEGAGCTLCYMVQKVYKPGSPKTFSPRVAFIDIPIQCMDRDDDTACRDPASDEDDDGCTATQEAAPGSNFSDNEWYDDDSLKGIVPPHDGYLENNLM